MFVKTEMTGPFIMEMPLLVVVSTCVDELRKLSVVFTRKVRSYNSHKPSSDTEMYNDKDTRTPFNFLINSYVEVLEYFEGHRGSRLNYEM